MLFTLGWHNSPPCRPKETSQQSREIVLPPHYSVPHFMLTLNTPISKHGLTFKKWFHFFFFLNFDICLFLFRMGSYNFWKVRPRRVEKLNGYLYLDVTETFEFFLKNEDFFLFAISVDVFISRSAYFFTK